MQTAKIIVNAIFILVLLITPAAVAMNHPEWSQDLFIGTILLGPFIVCFLLLDWYNMHLSDTLKGCMTAIGLFSTTIVLIAFYNAKFGSIPSAQLLHLDSKTLSQFKFGRLFFGCIGGLLAAVISIPRVLILRVLESFNERHDSA